MRKYTIVAYQCQNMKTSKQTKSKQVNKQTKRNERAKFRGM